MASLMDDLALVLESEVEQYKKLVALSEAMRDALVISDVSAVEQITADQESVANDLQALEGQRVRIMNDMALVLNRKPEELKVSALEESIGHQPQLQERLRNVRMELTKTMEELKRRNQSNQALLRQSMELLELGLNLLRSMRQAPETANYNKSAYNTGDLLGSRGFDAKQ